MVMLSCKLQADMFCSLGNSGYMQECSVGQGTAEGQLEDSGVGVCLSLSCSESEAYGGLEGHACVDRGWWFQGAGPQPVQEQAWLPRCQGRWW